ncbi:MAG: hypothetical protein AD073_000213 [Mycoplasmataceae bacterium]|nr:MAG: hypothetical protein AD073_000213 [Mycoplasmataceae bacterium]
MKSFKNILSEIFDLNEIVKSFYNSLYGWIIFFAYFFLLLVLWIIKENSENIRVTIFWALIFSSLIERILISKIRHFFFDYKIDKI